MSTPSSRTESVTGLYALQPLLLFTIVGRGLDLPWFAALMAALAIAVADLSWHSWEQPFLRLKRLFPMTRTPTRNVTACPPAA